MRKTLIGGVSALALTMATLAVTSFISTFHGIKSAAAEPEKPFALNGSTYAVVPGVVDRSAGGFLSSYFRLFNGGSVATNFSVTVMNTAGVQVGATKTIQIPPMASKQYPMSDILDLVAPGTAAGGSYSVYLSSAESTAGYQHVYFNGFTFLYENASVCKNLLSQVTLPYSASLVLVNVHSSVIEAFGFPMQVQLHNYAETAKTYNAKIYEGSTGVSRGQVSFTLQPNETRSLAFVSQMQTASGVTWTSTTEGFANVVITDASGASPYASVTALIDMSGKLGIGAATNMSTVCAVNAPTTSTGGGGFGGGDIYGN